ncbi:MAG TPA: PKD domain-containing protein, partial [Myxococcota bacterium]|nr:PKD domain-containing protein [Myxococcota bacterium]
MNRFAPRAARWAAVVVGLGTLGLASAAWAAVDVIPVPWNALDPAIPHQAYNGHPTTFKAIARGGASPYTVEWDFDGDGTFDVLFTSTDRYNLSTVYTYPAQAATVTFNAAVRVTSGPDVDVGYYPVRVFADVPADPTLASPRQLQIMRGVATDDALWWMHLNVTGRAGSEFDPFTGAQITGYFNHGDVSYRTASASTFIWANSLNGHFVAFPVGAYIGTFPAGYEPENDARWNNDPYAEDVLRNINWLLTNRLTIVSGIPAVDESNATGMYPEIVRTPIGGTDDGIGIYIGFAPGDMTTYPMGHALAALSVAHLAGLAAQVGDPTYVMGRPFEYIIQQMVDALTWAQIDGGCGDGGWYYTPNPPTTCDYMDASTNLWALTGLWHADEFMSDKGVIVSNRAKLRTANNFITNAYGLTATEYCARYRTSNLGCDFTLTAGHLLAAGWLGINNFDTADPVVAFPGYSAYTRGTLRTYYDRYLNMVGSRWLTFQESGVNTSWTSGLWELGSGGLADFERTDHLGNAYAMLHMQDAARAHVPALVNYGPNDWFTQFSIYLIQNQFADGHLQSDWCNNPTPGVCAYSDSSYGTTFLSTAWSVLILSPDAIPPLAIVDASPVATAEGTLVFFDGTESDPGTGNPTYSWDFGNGDTATGPTATYAFPDNGVYNVVLTLSSTGGTSSDVIAITVSNVAPTVDAGPDLVVDEGQPIPWTPTLTDPGSADTHTWAWDFGDGGTDTAPAPTYAYPDDGAFAVSVVVMDDDGDIGTDTVMVTVANVDPAITSTPPLTASEGTPYNYTVTYSDAGSGDTHACSLTTAPPGMTISGCDISWTPSFAAALGATATVVACVTDDDAGQACQTWDISVSFVDSDGDGLPDSWEVAYFGDVASQDAFGDPDNDGLANGQEFAGVTDPTVYDGPDAPVATLPTCGASVISLPPTLTVFDATDPQGGPLTYEFEVYSDVALTQLWVSATGVLPGGAGATAWTLPPTPGLLENDTYWWRARASDPYTAGAWSAVCDFTVNTFNEAPGAPGINAPAAGTQVTDATPSLVVDDAVDPDPGDVVTYTYELYADAGLTMLVGTMAGLPDGPGPTTTWSGTPTLLEDEWYYWRARAADLAGLTGPWSETGSFFVSALNAPPEAPTLLFPDSGSVVATLTPTLIILNADDPDLDTLSYNFELDVDATFSTGALQSGTNVPAEGEQTTNFTPADPLVENGTYCWRAQADDGMATSEWTMACFLVSEANDAPSTPTLMNPSDGSTVASLTPTLSWVSSVDPEGDAIRYDVEIYDNAALDGSPVASAARIEGNATTLDVELSAETDYWWRARAADALGEQSAWSEANRFTAVSPALGGINVNGSGGCDCRVAAGRGAAVGGECRPAGAADGAGVGATM